MSNAFENTRQPLQFILLFLTKFISSKTDQIIKSKTQEVIKWKFEESVEQCVWKYRQSLLSDTYLVFYFSVVRRALMVKSDFRRSLAA